MNTYLYAPKDDDKHRACWRDLYSLEEANQLSHLIHEATSRGIFFVYAIAPGEQGGGGGGGHERYEIVGFYCLLPSLVQDWI